MQLDLRVLALEGPFLDSRDDILPLLGSQVLVSNRKLRFELLCTVIDAVNLGFASISWGGIWVKLTTLGHHVGL